MTDNVRPIRNLTNMTRIEQLLEDPASDSSLEVLKAEMNELAILRQNSRLAFCKRLALVWLIIVGATPGQGKRSPKAVEFRKWCDKNIRSANGKRYTIGTLRTYLRTGFAADPEGHLRKVKERDQRRKENFRRLASGIVRAVNAEDKPKTLPITVLRTKYNLDTDVAREVNSLMRAWEEASTEARTQFIYQVTGRRLS